MSILLKLISRFSAIPIKILAIFFFLVEICRAQLVKNPPANAGDVRAVVSILGSGRSPGGGHGNPSGTVFLPGESHGQWSLESYSPLGHKESDMAEAT